MQFFVTACVPIISASSVTVKGTVGSISITYQTVKCFGKPPPSTLLRLDYVRLYSTAPVNFQKQQAQDLALQM